MAEDSEKKPVQNADKSSEFFNVGAPLHAVRPGYVRRSADDLLFDTLVAGNYAHVIAPDRTGKTSLIASTSARLQNNGFKVAILDLAQIGERDGGSDGGRWYYSIAYRLSRQLRLKTDLQTWWQDHSILSNRQRLVEFYLQVVLHNIDERIVVFIDEVQSLAELPFAEHLLASIRTAHNSRTTEPEFNRLGFVTIGDCDPQSLISELQLSPFPVSTEIRLNDFLRDDLAVFAAELNLAPADAEQALDRIFHWTSGQPYLSQKLARAVSREKIECDIAENVDRLAQHQLAGRAAIRSEPHLSHLHRVILGDKKNYEALLTLYGQIRKGIRIDHDPESALHRKLLAIGLVVINREGEFHIRNRVYEAVFTARWANENLPLHWRGPAVAALIILALTAIPFAYTQLLPKPYLHVMSDADHDLGIVSDAYQNLRSFPGHVAAADRMYQSVIENRSRSASTRSQIREIARYAALLPDGVTLADDLTAAFWDRQVNVLMREERREDALLASLEALVVTTQERRRRASSLVGDDYSQLIATVQAPIADGLVFNSENVQLTWHRGAEIMQWSYAGDSVQSRETWTMSALEVTPLVRRVIVDRDGAVSRIGLTINVSHARLDDIRIKLIAPSGRATDLTFAQASSSTIDEIRVEREQLLPLLGETLTGTWSLSLRDEATGVTGHLVGWNLSLNSQVVVESFERGLDIPDPVERPSENLWFSPDGRYAIARALQSDSARLWDLNFAQAARTIAVPASEQVIGLGASAGFLVTRAQNSVNLWRTSDGRRAAVLEVGTAISDTRLSADGLYLLVSYRTDTDTLFEVWSLELGEIIADINIAGVPALVSIDASATHLAVADFDRAVRVWNLRNGEFLAQIDLRSQPSDIHLSANGEALGVILNDQGLSLWNTSDAAAPVFQDFGEGEWHMAFSPSGARFLAGNKREGMQVYRSSDGVPSGPLLDPGLVPGVNQIFSFSTDEATLVTAGVGDVARFWTMPVISAELSADMAPERGFGQTEAVAAPIVVNAIAPGGERIAFGDRSGHVHIQEIDATVRSVEVDSDEISFLGHLDAVLSMVFSHDGALIASAGADGTIRVWDAHSGLPRPFYGKSPLASIDRMELSPSASQLAVLSGQRVWLMDTETGTELASIDLGETHSDLAFSADGQLFLAGNSGTLRNLYADPTGNWHLRNVWQGRQAIRNLAIGPTRHQIVLVDDRNQVRLLDPRDGRIGTEILQLPDIVTDVSFSPNESRVLFRTGRWIHRALVSPTGLIWTDTVRAPKALHGSRMVFKQHTPATASRDAVVGDQSGDRVLILATDTGVARLTEIRFSYSEGPALFGSKPDLLSEWTEKLRGASVNAFVREGF
jgi:WD40 repeat protein